MMPVVDGGLLPVAPDVAVATGSAADVPLLIGTTRDETAFFTVGDPALGALDDDGLRRWMRRLSPDRRGRGRASSPRSPRPGPPGASR